MIALLTGKLVSKKPTYAVVDVNGVGYRIHISLNTFYSLPDEGQVVAIHTHTHVREDTISLFGFSTPGEKEVFTRLIAVSGIGPRLALTILSGIPFKELIGAIGEGDLVKLSSIPGIGKKTSERLVMELKDKFADMAHAAGGHLVSHTVSDEYSASVEALVTLGYKKAQARKAVDDVVKESPDLDLETLLKESLKRFSR